MRKSICVFFIVLGMFFCVEEIAVSRQEWNCEKFNMEFKKGYQLVYGEWKITEFLGGGMPGYSMGISSEGQKNLIEQNETIKIHPDYVIVDGKKL